MMTSLRDDATGQYRQLYGFSLLSMYTAISQAVEKEIEQQLTGHLMASQVSQTIEFCVALRTGEVVLQIHGAPWWHRD